MLLLEFFEWWYGDGWRQALKGSLNLINKVQLSFSLPVLLSTLFAPWKRIITPPGQTLDEKMRAMLDNLVSRVVGFVMRLFSLIAAVILVILAAVIGIVTVVAWPLIPVLIVFSLLKAVA